MITASQLAERIEIEGWQDYLLIGSLVFVGLILLFTFLRGGGKGGGSGGGGGGGGGGKRRRR